MNNIIPSSSVISIDPNNLQPQSFSEADGNIIPNYKIDSLFNPTEDNIEFFVYDYSNNLIHTNYNFEGWKTENDPSLSLTNQLSTIDLDPIKDSINAGFDNGEINVVYNFISKYFSSSIDNLFYIDEISSDRTELRLRNNFMSDLTLSTLYNDFSSSILANNEYYDEFYLNLLNNNYIIATNALYDSGSLLIKLYEELPNQFIVNNELFIVSKPAESVAYNIKFNNLINIQDDIINIKGPNLNLNISNHLGVSTEYENINSLINSPNSGSTSQLNSIFDFDGVEINADYSDFSSFINFSSAKQRLINFYYKVKSIEDYQSELNSIYGIIGSTSSSISVSSSKNIIESKINDIITHLDKYEYYLYYDSGSYSWPKTNSVYPFSLASTGSIQLQNWLGSDIENSQYYGGILLSASLYDNDNQNNLFYTIPEFISNNEDNSQYLLFSNMVGQFFDDIWLYIKGITEKLNADNRILHGVSKDLAADVIRSLGFNTYTNNFSIHNLYSSFLGVDASGSFSLPTGSELITDYINVDSGSANPYSINDINQEIYKRLYHNLSYILKKKGTTQAIKELANIYGIPSTILRINEFGGKDRDGNEWDYWQNTFNYAYTTDGSAGDTPIRTYWYAPSGTSNKPETILFRFKFPTFFSNQDYLINPSQSLFYINAASAGAFPPFMSLTVDYTGSLLSGSYSGSNIDPYYQYGTVKFILSGSASPGYYTASVYLPIFNGDWWSVMVRRETDNNINLFVKNKGYHGYDGNVEKYYASASLNTTDTSRWITPVLIGSPILRFGEGSLVNSFKDGKRYNWFSGSLQEIRFYNKPLSEEAFDSYVMNPLSIEGNVVSGSETAFNILSFRASLGSELEHLSSSFYATSSIQGGLNYLGNSIHPSTTGSYPTSSNPVTAGVVPNNGYTLSLISSFGTSWYFAPNIEYVYLNESISGIKSRITDKITIPNLILPPGENVLSSLTSIQQSIPISNSYGENINYLEVAFSPQDEVNNDITGQLGAFNLGEFIGDPRQRSSSAVSYPDLNNLGVSYFKKCISNYDVWDYIRLIKYYDNSLFKLIKDFTPAKTSLSSGIVIKQHLLERNKYPTPKTNITSSIFWVATGSTDKEYYLENIYLTASIGSTEVIIDGQKTYVASGDYESNPIETTFGGTGGVMPDPELIRFGLSVTTGSHTYPSVVTSASFALSDVLADNRNGYNITNNSYLIRETTQNPLTVRFYSDITFGGVGNTPTLRLNSSIRGILAESQVNTSPNIWEFSYTDIFYADEVLFLTYGLTAVNVNTSNTLFTIEGDSYIFPNVNRDINQSWSGYNNTIVGLLPYTHSTCDEFYNGEFEGSKLQVTEQRLIDEHCEQFLYASTAEIRYNYTVYSDFETFLGNSNINGRIFIFKDSTRNTYPPNRN